MRNRFSLQNVETALSIRSLLALVSFSSNMFIAKTIVKASGAGQFAIYGLITSLPGLLPFADFGLGRSLYNNLVNKFANKKIDRGDRILFTDTFFILSIISCSAILSIFIVDQFFSLGRIFALNYYGDFDLYVMMVFSLMWISVPFSIGFNVLEAAGKINLSIGIQIMIPVFSIVGIWTCYITKTYQYNTALLFPSLGYFLSCLISFKLASKYVKGLKTSVGSLIKTLHATWQSSIWSLAVITFLALTLQIPRYILINNHRLAEAAKYTYAAFFLIPMISLIQISSSWLAVRVKMERNRSVQNLIIKRQTIKTFIYVSFALSTLYLLTIIKPNFFGVHLALQDWLVMYFSLLFANLFGIPLRSLTSVNFLRFFAILGFTVLTSLTLLCYLINTGSNFAIFLEFLLPMNCILAFATTQYLRKNSIPL